MKTLVNVLTDYNTDKPKFDLDTLPTKSNYLESKAELKSYNIGIGNRLERIIEGSGTVMMAYDGHLPMGLNSLLPNNIPTYRGLGDMGKLGGLGAMEGMADVSFTSKTAFIRQPITPVLIDTNKLMLDAATRTLSDISASIPDAPTDMHSDSYIGPELVKILPQLRSNQLRMDSLSSIHPVDSKGSDYWINTGLLSRGHKPEWRYNSLSNMMVHD